jgi:hypothetical protein
LPTLIGSFAGFASSRQPRIASISRRTERLPGALVRKNFSFVRRRLIVVDEVDDQFRTAKLQPTQHLSAPLIPEG